MAVTAEVLRRMRSLVDLIEAHPELGGVSGLDVSARLTSAVYLDMDGDPVASLLAWSEHLDGPEVGSHGDERHYVFVSGRAAGFTVRVVSPALGEKARAYLAEHELSLSSLRAMVESGVLA